MNPKKKLRETIAYCDQRKGPGSSLAENLLRDYVRLLYKLGYSERASYYNSKLDNPFILTADKVVVEDD